MDDEKDPPYQYNDDYGDSSYIEDESDNEYDFYFHEEDQYYSTISSPPVTDDESFELGGLSDTSDVNLEINKFMQKKLEELHKENREVSLSSHIIHYIMTSEWFYNEAK
jgi:hypothetical protein